MKEFETAKKLLDDLKINQPIIIDGGACHGSSILECLKHWPNAQIYAFEARPDLSKKLDNKFKSQSNVHIYNQLLGEKNEVMNFHVTSEFGTGSVLPPSARAQNYHKGLLDVVNVIRLDCVNLDDSFSNVDLIKLDIHGAELPTLQGSLRLLPQMKVLIIEMLFFESFVGQAPFYKLSEFLYGQKFELFNFFNLASHPSGKLGGGDVIFTNTRFFPNV